MILFKCLNDLPQGNSECCFLQNLAKGDKTFSFLWILLFNVLLNTNLFIFICLAAYKLWDAFTVGT